MLTSSKWIDIEVGNGQPPLRYVGSTPSTRFPTYTRGNAGEVYPAVVWPLSYTMAFEGGTRGFEASQVKAGVLRAKDLHGDPTALNGVFGGYAYLNLSAMRVLAIRSVGVTTEEVDRLFMGASTAAPHAKRREDQSLRGTVSSVLYGLSTLRAKSLPHLDREAATVAQMLTQLPDTATASDDDLWNAAVELLPLGEQLFASHLFVSGQASVPLALLSKFCREQLGDDSLAMQLLTGAGSVESADPARELWKLGRLVEASPALTAAFDGGVLGIAERLVSGHADPAMVAFTREFDQFLKRFGSRGPNEWETACPTWGTNPELALALVDRMRTADSAHDPAVAQTRLSAQRLATLEECCAKLGKRKAKRLRALMESALMFSQGREQAKTTVIAAIHGSRLLLRELGRRCAARARAAGNAEAADDDLWFVAVDEVAEYRAEPAAFAERIAERRVVREQLAALVPPFTFTGEQPPLCEWERRSDQSTQSVRTGAVLTGIAGCPGVARGRARIVLDPSNPGDLGPGDILVAPITDPAWTPLFLSAEGVVVDVGAQLSHAVIVSRELGIPCVVSVTGATRSIPDGALIEVNGTAGTVTVLDIALVP